jgi:hypothetical protein
VKPAPGKAPTTAKARLAAELLTPCITCGALPTGLFPDRSRKYSCGPHPPVTAKVQP